METTTKPEIQITYNHGRAVKGRVFTSHGPTDYAHLGEFDQCTDGACEAFQCRRAHMTWLLNFLLEGRGDFVADRFMWRAEEDHKQWKAASRKAIAAEREMLLAALPQITKARFSIHAGCNSCPCSPGWVVEGLWNKTAYVTF